MAKKINIKYLSELCKIIFALFAFPLVAFTSIIIGLNIGEASLLIAAIGALICFFSKKTKISNIGKALLGFGLIFFGLEMMGNTLMMYSKE